MNSKNTRDQELIKLLVQDKLYTVLTRILMLFAITVVFTAICIVVALSNPNSYKKAKPEAATSGFIHNY
ncbi:hypothetical protein SAMN04487764_1538 [Gillisia sp. Hel1_33_143]|uniref:hypothetical protein n=1 Tax=Gillisia sp. Hel1_33_143 TaxID=1336796 RepID=UPI00087DCD45|nr:hypothetical protein [Gillisia sp. Hel1_33_143]SDS13826.1 hypothetical protein SAMN04487764_1538 [Gillisia sp. Hel1_33_143]